MLRWRAPGAIATTPMHAVSRSIAPEDAWMALAAKHYREHLRSLKAISYNSLLCYLDTQAFTRICGLGQYVATSYVTTAICKTFTTPFGDRVLKFNNAVGTGKRPKEKRILNKCKKQLKLK